MNWNKKIKEWFGFPVSKTKMPSYLEEVQSEVLEKLNELNASEKKLASKKNPSKKKGAAKKKATAKKKAPAKKKAGSGKPHQVK